MFIPILKPDKPIRTNLYIVYTNISMTKYYGLLVRTAITPPMLKRIQTHALYSMDGQTAVLRKTLLTPFLIRTDYV